MLEVRSRLRQSFFAKMKLAGQVILCMAVVLALCFGTWHGFHLALDGLLYKNEAFSIQRISVHTDGVLSTNRLMAAAGLKLGKNLLALDLARVKRDLELIPRVQTAVLERHLPDSLTLSVRERVPIVRVPALQPRQNEQSRIINILIDRFGFVVEVMDERSLPVGDVKRRKLDRLPILLSVDFSTLHLGSRIQAQGVLSALNLIQTFRQTSMYGMVAIESIRLTPGRLLEIETNEGSRIVFGASDLRRQFTRWQMIHEHGRQQGLKLDYLDLSIENYIPATWKEPFQTASGLDSNSVVIHPKDKHV